MRILIISTYPPLKCGIATFTKDLYYALKYAGNDQVDILAMSDQEPLLYPTEVVSILKTQHQKSYIQQAHWINANYDICIIQHEYGIFGGPSGTYIIELAKALQIPLITHLHTILPHPSELEKDILAQLIKLSDLITVMTPYAINLLKSIYTIPSYKLALIPHGVPTFDFNQAQAKSKLNLNNEMIILSFGFLGRNKGIETALKALANLKKDKNIADKLNSLNLKYIVLGATHPNVVKHEGESYRESLIALTKELNIEHQVSFIDEFVNDEKLKDYLTACDIYISPYPGENQISSGTLSYALGAGAAVISTPYLYARDLLAEDRGILFDFENIDQLSQIIQDLCTNHSYLEAYRNRAKEYGKHLQWPQIGKKYLSYIHQLHHQPKQLWN